MKLRVASPPPETIALCEALDSAAGLLLSDVAEPFEGFGRYESDVEVRVLFVGLLRHVEALLECARADAALLSAGYTMARATFERSIRIRWILHSSSVWEREARVLAHLAEEEGMWRRCARHSGVEAFLAKATEVECFRKKVLEMLPSEVRRVAAVPSVDAMLKELGEPNRYTAYVLLSQHIHGTHFAGQIQRAGLGSAKRFRDQASASDWCTALEIAWWSLVSAAQAIELTCARRPLKSITPEVIAAIDGKFAASRAAHGIPSAPADVT